MKYCEDCKERYNLKIKAFQLFNEVCDICGKKTVTVYYDEGEPLQLNDYKKYVNCS